MMSEHTPGPLEVETWEGQDYWPILGKNPDEGKEGVCYAGRGIRVADAHEEYYARLMAAAPDLLAALENLRKELHAAVRLDVKKHYSLMVAEAIAGTAIRKARGEA
jgi:hypothetical protein